MSTLDSALQAVGTGVDDGHRQYERPIEEYCVYSKSGGNLVTLTTSISSILVHLHACDYACK